MIIKSANMEYEQCQDLSDLAWFEKPLQPWGAAEISGGGNATSHIEQLSPEMAYESSADYNLTDFDPFYTISRSDSMEELKRVAAPMEVAPMLHCNATLPMSNLIKTEYNDEDMTVADADQTDQKLDPNFLKMDPDMLLLDTPDLLSELGGCDLIDYIISEGSPRCDEPAPTVDMPVASAITAAKNAAIKATPNSEFRPPFLSQQNYISSQRRNKPESPPPFKKVQKKPAMKETYLAIPRKLTSGSTDDKKIPKMLILKTADTSTINLHDLGISIAERIKTLGKRPRPKRFSESDDDDDDDDDEDYKYESDDNSSKRKNSKRSRRLSTSSSTSLSDRYRELRDKNNEASRKSRQNRKEKEKDLSKTLASAERENMKLKARSDELEKLVHSLRKLLLQIVINKGSSR